MSQTKILRISKMAITTLPIFPIGHDEHAAVPTGSRFAEKIHLRCGIHTVNIVCMSYIYGMYTVIYIQLSVIYIMCGECLRFNLCFPHQKH